MPFNILDQSFDNLIDFVSIEITFYKFINTTNNYND